MDICQSVFSSFFARAALGQYDLDQPAQLLRLLTAMSRKKLIDQARVHQATRRDHRRLRPGSQNLRKVPDGSLSPSQQVVREMFLAGESMHVENFVQFYNEDARYQFSNFPVVVGPKGIIDASQDFIETVKYCVHHIQNLWEIDHSTLVCEMTVDYVRKKDLKKFALPCCDTIRLKNWKVQDLRIFMDIMPVFAD